jgi:hypothetical protein
MSLKSFGASLLALPEIFRDKFFVIPDYQRGYSWEKKQIKEMLRDIGHLLDGGAEHSHYTGTLVLSRSCSRDRYDIVDGQQRLTTLVILISEISRRLEGEAKIELSNRYLKRGDVGSEKNVLQLSVSTRTLFENVILTGKSHKSENLNTVAQVRLIEARKTINDWLDKKTKTGIAPERYLPVIETKLGFLVFAPNENSETGIMFEVINNRGKPLSELEKVKNFLIYASAKMNADSLRSEIDSEWSSILSNLNDANNTSSADEGSFLRYCMAVHFKLSKQDSQHGYEQIKKILNLDKILKNRDKIPDTIATIRGFLEFLKSASAWYARLYGQKHMGLERPLIEILDRIRLQGAHASIMPTFLAIVIKNQEDNQKSLRLLELLEILNFRVYMARGMTSRNDSGQAWLYGDASLYYHSEILEELDDRKYKSIIKSENDALETELVHFIIDNAPNEQFLESFRLSDRDNFDFYRWNGLRYFLINYEQSLHSHKTIPIEKIARSRKDGKTNDYLSVEHLWATKNRIGAGENDRPTDRLQKRRLGNFVLLEFRLNSQADNHDLCDKILRYDGVNTSEPPSELMQVRKASEITTKSYKAFKSRKKAKGYYYDLHREIFDQIETNYCCFASDRWSIENFLGYKEISSWYEEGEV